MYNKLYLGDCVQVLKSFPENSIDCIVSDPPYGIAFMGKEWDKALPSKEAFEQMNRVLKPVEVKQDIKQVVKNISKSNRPRCGYEGKCDLRDKDGNCLTKKHCMDKVI